MATLTIRNIEPELKASLRQRAATNGRSMEEEVRQLLRAALLSATPARLGTRINRRFADLDAADLDLPPRDEAPRVGDLGS